MVQSAPPNATAPIAPRRTIAIEYSGVMERSLTTNISSNRIPAVPQRRVKYLLIGGSTGMCGQSDSAKLQPNRHSG